MNEHVFIEMFVFNTYILYIFHYRKTIRATIILMPLLGLTNVLFLVNPEDRSSFQLAYHITNAILQSTGVRICIITTQSYNGY